MDCWSTGFMLGMIWLWKGEISAPRTYSQQVGLECIVNAILYFVQGRRQRQDYTRYNDDKLSRHCITHSSDGHGEVVLNTLMTDWYMTVLHAVLMENGKVDWIQVCSGWDNTVCKTMQGSLSYMGYAGWPELCAMRYERVSQGVVQQMNMGEVKSYTHWNVRICSIFK